MTKVQQKIFIFSTKIIFVLTSRDTIDDLISKTQNQMQEALIDLAEKKDK